MSNLLSIPKLADPGAAGRAAPAHVVSAVRQASAATGVDFAYLMEKASVESGFRTDVKAKTSSATGLFQFVEKTWLQMVRDHGAEHGLARFAAAIGTDRNGNPTVADKAMRAEILELRKDPRTSALLAAELANDNREVLESELGREVGKTELYLAHFLGAGGAAKFLKGMERDPSQPAAALLPEAARANRAVFYGEGGRPRSLEEVRDRFAGKFDEDAAMLDRSTRLPSTVAEETGSQPWLSSRSGASGREPVTTFTILQLNALLPPSADGGDDKDGDGDAPKAPNLMAGGFSI